MSKQILKELSELVEANVISEDTAQRITNYYNAKPSQSASRLFIVFGILGSLLIGMGIVLIIAHNWDDLSKVVKLTVGLVPLLIGQGLAAFTLIKKSEQKAWREGSGAFLFFTVAVSISIVSQVYNIEGSMAGFLLVWMSLCLPIVYVLWSSVTSLLFIVGITWYGCEVGYFDYPVSSAPYYWVLLGLILPFYYLEFIRKNQKNNFFYFHSWLLVLTVTICLGTFTAHAEELMMIAYMSLFSLWIILSQMKWSQTNRVLTNAFLVIGSLGVMGSLLSLSFDWFWDDLYREDSLKEVFKHPEFYVSLLITILAACLFFVLHKSTALSNINSKSFAFLIFIVLFFVGISAPAISQLLINLLILAFAVHTIRDGAKKDHLGILNYGLLIITALITCRFFDTDFSFVLRGLLFIGVGIGFFAANYYAIQKRKKQSNI
jgi:uncharacterized membrane protein